MTIKLLKYFIKIIINPLVYIYNISIKKNIFPDFLKLAVVKQILKGGDQKYVKNYRPISLLRNFAKIFEKIIKQRLIYFLKEHKHLSKNQFEFRPSLDTENFFFIFYLIFSMTQFIYNELDNSSKFLAVFKAFDTVNHTICFKFDQLLELIM